MTPDMKAAAAEAHSGCKQVLAALAEPMLNQLGPAVLRAVKRVEKAQSSGQVSSSSSSSRSVQLSGLTGEVNAEQQLEDAVMSDFGGLELKYSMHGEARACEWRLSSAVRESSAVQAVLGLSCCCWQLMRAHKNTNCANCLEDLDAETLLVGDQEAVCPTAHANHPVLAFTCRSQPLQR
jgi:hypothetical protein